MEEMFLKCVLAFGKNCNIPSKKHSFENVCGAAGRVLGLCVCVTEQIFVFSPHFCLLINQYIFGQGVPKTRPSS